LKKVLRDGHRGFVGHTARLHREFRAQVRAQADSSWRMPGPCRSRAPWAVVSASSSNRCR
jgi:hypothetical protein